MLKIKNHLRMGVAMWCYTWDWTGYMGWKSLGGVRYIEHLKYWTWKGNWGDAKHYFIFIWKYINTSVFGMEQGLPRHSVAMIKRAANGQIITTRITMAGEAPRQKRENISSVLWELYILLLYTYITYITYICDRFQQYFVKWKIRELYVCKIREICVCK